jgi:hypothetical protein
MPSPGGSVFGSCVKPAPLHAFRATSPPAFQLVTLSQPTRPPYLSHVNFRKSHRCRAQGLGFRFVCQTGPPSCTSGYKPPSSSNHHALIAYEAPYLSHVNFRKSRRCRAQGARFLSCCFPLASPQFEPKRLEFRFLWLIVVSLSMQHQIFRIFLNLNYNFCRCPQR